MSYRLTIANIRNQPELVNEVIKLLTDLKGAWEAIEKDQIKSLAISQIPSSADRQIADYAGV
jgi:flagellar protein FliS